MSATGQALIVAAATVTGFATAYLAAQLATRRWGVPQHPAATASDRMNFSLAVAALASTAVAAAVFWATTATRTGPPPTATTTTPATTTTTTTPTAATTTTVSAARGWQDSGVLVAAGEDVEITATGQWHPFGNGYAVGPDGCTDPVVCSQDPDQTNNVCCTAHAGLIGMIGSSPPFAVGGERTLHNTGPAGELRLRINDTVLEDNTGDMAVTVRHPIPAPTPP
ncbi:hypothetical protein ACFVVX_12020 [Kitasatospora sp. NPDC058170]|uniref:hypothetical protein n=1 Tax=Kitasatospora sp. NPDC058170 TaxID=3346364 RepID=UPI0036DCF235